MCHFMRNERLFSTIITIGTYVYLANAQRIITPGKICASGSPLGVQLEAIYKSPVDCETPLHDAVKQEDCEKICYLLKRSTPINARDKHGKTALHYAMERRYHDIVLMLVAKGADLQIKDEDGVTPWDLADDAEMMAKVLQIFPSWTDTFNKLLQSLWERGRVVLWDGCNPQVSVVANANSCRMKKLHARSDTRGNADQYTSGLSVVVPILKVEGNSFVVLNPSSTDHASLVIEITETPLEDSMQDYTTSFRHRETGRILAFELHKSIQAVELTPCEGTNKVICGDLFGKRPVTEDFEPIVGYIVDKWFALKIVEDIDTKMRLIFQREDLPPGKITAPSQLQYNLDESGRENLTISAGIETMPTRYSIANYKEPENPKLEDLRVDPVESLAPLGRVHEDNHELIQQLIRFIHTFTAADLLSGRRENISPDYVAMKDEASGD